MTLTKLFASDCTEGLPLDYTNMFGHLYVHKNEIHSLDLTMTTRTDTRLATDLKSVQNTVFVDFDKEYLKNQDFRQNVSNPARCSAFFMYTLFLLINKSSWRNIGFTVENDVKRSIQTHNACIIMFWTSFLDSKSNISSR